MSHNIGAPNKSSAARHVSNDARWMGRPERSRTGRVKLTAQTILQAGDKICLESIVEMVCDTTSWVNDRQMHGAREL